MLQRLEQAGVNADLKWEHGAERGLREPQGQFRGLPATERGVWLSLPLDPGVGARVWGTLSPLPGDLSSDRAGQRAPVTLKSCDTRDLLCSGA